jgi:hypothetical protein
MVVSDTARQKCNPLLAERRMKGVLLGNGAVERTAVSFPEHFWRRGPKFLPLPAIGGTAVCRPGPLVRHLPASRHNLRARRRLSATGSR